MKLKKILALACISSMIMCTPAFAKEVSEKHYNVGVTWLNSSAEAADGWAYVGYGVSENVFLQDAEGKLYSTMVETVEQIDEMTWKLTLKEGIKFSDGSDITPELFCAGLNESMEDSSGTSTCGKLTFVPEEDGSITVTTERPTTVLESALCEMNFVVYKYDEEGNPVFTGPYVIDEFDPGVSMELVPNTYYDDRAAERPSITVKSISDNNSMVQAFQAGELDMAYALTPDSAEQLKTEGFTVIDFDGGYQYFAILNLNREPFDDIRVREAINFAMNRDEMVSALYGCLPATGFFGHKFDFNADIEFKTDVEQAKTLLSEAGYEDSDGDGYVDKDGKNLSFEITTYNMHPELPTMMQVMVSQLDAIGIEVTTNVLDGGMDKFASEGDYDVILYGGYTGNTSDPAAKLNAFFKTGGGTNYNGYSNEDVDRKLEEMDSMAPGEERNAAAIEIQEIVEEDLPVIYLIDSQFHAAVTEDLANYVPYGGDYYTITAEFGLS